MEEVREYQDYVLAYRLRAVIGGKLRPARQELSLAEYAKKRLERQKLAKSLIGQSDYHITLRSIDHLTEELNFGFWHNPNESLKVLRIVIEQGGCRTLESAEGFLQDLLTRREREQLSAAEQKQVCDYYLGLFRASAAYLDAEVFTRLRAEVEVLRDSLPVFVPLSPSATDAANA